MRALRIVLIIDALVIVAGSLFSDRIVGAVVIAPALLVGVILAIACLSGDLVRPRRRVEWICSALTIVLPFPFFVLGYPLGPQAAAVAIVVLQLIPLSRTRFAAREGIAPRSVLGALVITTALLLVLVGVLVWYGNTYLLKPPATLFARGPYLTRVTTTQADLAWQLKPGTTGTVHLRALAPDGTVVEGAAGFTDLRPGTRYLWTANVGGRSAAAGAFTTAPLTTAQPITLVSFGDYGSGNAHEYAVGRLAAAAEPAMMLSAGDNSYLLAAPPLLNRAIFDPLHALLAQAPMVAALGEHDLAYDDGSAVISALHLPGHQYSAQYGPVQVVVLGLEADASALRFARTTLGVCQGPCPVRFVLTHRPIDTANPIMPLLRRRHVAAILAGHLHRYERHERAGILQFTVGTGGEGPGDEANTRATPDAIRSFLAYGFLRIRIAGTRISYQFIDEQGQVRDEVNRTVIQ
jgi:tartrate-resistant acid phosphatase type 5